MDTLFVVIEIDTAGYYIDLGRAYADRQEAEREVAYHTRHSPARDSGY